MQEELGTLFEEHWQLLDELGVTPEQAAGLKLHLDQVIETNRHMNLVSRKAETRELFVKHLVDSLLALPELPQAQQKPPL